MIMANRNGNIERPRIDSFQQSLDVIAPVGAAESLLVAPGTLQQTSFHDFAFHQYLLPTERGFIENEIVLSDGAESYIAAAEDEGAPPDVVSELRTFLTDLESAIGRAVYETAPPYVPSGSPD